MFLDNPTWKFIFAALKSEPDTEVLIRLSTEGFDESELLKICRDHGILLIVNDSLKEVAQQVFPAEGLEAWRSAVAASTMHSLEMHRELEHLTALFNEAGLPFVPFKGPMLSESLYGDPLLRMSADLDLLVPRDHVTGAVDLMIAHGYQLTSDRSDLARWLEPNSRYFHCGLLNPTRKWLVELHWLLFAGWRKTHFPQSTEADCFPGGVGDVMETLLYLCSHGAHHWWIELKWVVDVDRCVRSAHDLDWQELLARAGDRGCLRVLLLSLMLAQKVCGLEIPEVVSAITSKDRKIAGLACRVSKNWALPKSQWPSLFWKMRYLLDCRERWSDKIGMIIDYPLMRSLSSP
jgi:hypothetical protein